MNPGSGSGPSLLQTAAALAALRGDKEPKGKEVYLILEVLRWLIEKHVRRSALVVCDTSLTNKSTSDLIRMLCKYSGTPNWLLREALKQCPRVANWQWRCICDAHPQCKLNDGVPPWVLSIFKALGFQVADAHKCVCGTSIYQCKVHPYVVPCSCHWSAECACTQHRCICSKGVKRACKADKHSCRCGPIANTRHCLKHAALACTCLVGKPAACKAGRHFCSCERANPRGPATCRADRHLCSCAREKTTCLAERHNLYKPLRR